MSSAITNGSPVLSPIPEPASKKEKTYSLINSPAGFGGVGTAAGTVFGYLFAPAVIDKTVRFACSKILPGISGQVVGAIIGPVMANNFSLAAIPCSAALGGLGCVGLHYASKRASHYFASGKTNDPLPADPIDENWELIEGVPQNEKPGQNDEKPSDFEWIDLPPLEEIPQN